jgi:hypothetical protein
MEENELQDFREWIGRWYEGVRKYPHNITYVNNTAVAAWRGKDIGIYGGINDTE